MELKKQSNRTTRLVRPWTERTCGEAVDHAGRAGCSKGTGCVGVADLRGN